ncbi:MAG: WGR domain-containing protein [Archangium sp.]|nr:WGR domain-containing protein [Archangium sp.]
MKWGRLGTTGQQKTHAFATPSEARAELEALVAEKTKKGYRRVDAPVQPPRDAKLERAMFQARDDEGPALVYADWLQANGNPWGELISVQYALETKPKDKTLRAKEKALLGALQLLPPDLGALTWRRGVIDTLHVFNARDWMDDAHDVFATLQPVLELPMADGLAELRTGVIRWDHNTEDVPAVLAAASKRPFAPRLERLVLGDLPRNVDMDHHVIGDVRALSKQFPNLTFLKLHSGAASWSGAHNFDFGPLALSSLETLVVETCSMSTKRLRQVLESALPKLTRLELWFGSTDYGADVKVKHLSRLLDGAVFPRVTDLGLRNAEFTNELATALPGSGIARRLVRLDLSMGVLDGGGAKSLVAGAKSFPKLKTLVVSQSHLAPGDIKALKQGFPGVDLEAKDQKHMPGEPHHRYVTVGE